MAKQIIPYPLDVVDTTNVKGFTDAELAEDYLFWSRRIAESVAVTATLRAFVEFQAEAETEMKQRGLNVPQT